MNLRALALLLLALCACGGASASATAPDQAHIAQTAADPRTDDPTAAQPVPIAEPTPAPKPDPEPDPSFAAGTNEREPRMITARHVLIQWLGADRGAPNVMRSRDQARALAEEVLKKARAGQDLGRLAIEYSDEPGAGQRGGSLGRFHRGQMVPAFEDVAFKLKVGQISGIIETEYGFHIIQRTE